MSLEGTVGWLKDVYSQEWPTLVNHIVATSVSLGASSGVANAVSDENAPLVSSLVDMGTYWGTFVPQLAYRDREDMKEGGKYKKELITRKATEYASMFSIVEGAYLLVRGYAQSKLQQHGMDPATASFFSQLGVAGLFTLGVPMLRYGLRRIFKRE